MLQTLIYTRILKYSLLIGWCFLTCYTQQLFSRTAAVTVYELDMDVKTISCPFLSYVYVVKFTINTIITHHCALAVAKGFFNTKITESPRKNILAMYLSLLIGFAFFPFPVFGISYHISFTFSSTMLQCLSNALTRPNNFLLLRQLIRTCVLFFTDVIRTDNGPVLNSSSSLCFNSSNVNSDLGLLSNEDIVMLEIKQDIKIHWQRVRGM